MPEPKAPSPSFFTDDLLVLLFALGDATLTFHDLKKLADIVLAQTQGKHFSCDEAELRAALQQHPHIRTPNGNYFTCHEPHLYLHAINYLNQSRHREVVEHIASSLPFATPDQVINLSKLFRDIRNALFAQDVNGLYHYLVRLYKEFPDEFACGRPFQELADPIYIPWIVSLPNALFSACVIVMFPYMISHFCPMQRMLERAKRDFAQLHKDAHLPIIDALIVAGQLSAAYILLNSLVNTPTDTLQTRYGWLDFIEGNLNSALNRYGDALENQQQKNYGNEFYFSTITGIFYIFALIKDNSPSSIGNAISCTRAARNNPLYGRIYSQLHYYINYLRGFHDERPILGNDATPLDRFISCFVDFWCNGGLPDEDSQQTIYQLKEQAREAGLCWIENELGEIKYRSRFVRYSEEKPDSFPCVPLVDCVKIVPTWSSNLDTIAFDLSMSISHKPYRAIWSIAFSPESPTEVQLELYEQHQSKKGRWSKGQKIPIERLRRGLRRDGVWPVYFTPQDIRAASVLLQLEQKAAEQKQPEHQGHNDVLLYLTDCQRLFWADDEAQNHVQVVLEEPYVQLLKSEEPGHVTFKLFPDVSRNSTLTAIRYADGSLHLFCFKQFHLQLYERVKKGFLIPEQAFPQLKSIFLQIAKTMTIKSDYGLDTFDYLETQIVRPQPILRLELKTSGELHVELLMQPFAKDETLCRPFEGTQAVLVHENGRLIRKLRDQKCEEEIVQNILETCHTLNTATDVAPFQWLVENQEAAFQLMTQIQNLSDCCNVYWKQERKISVSKRISFGDVSMSAKHGSHWLDIDGNVTVDEQLTLSFQKLLELARTQKGNFIQIDDTQILCLADEFRATLDNLNCIGQHTRSRTQFNTLALPVLQVMLDNFAEVDISPEWREQLRQIDEAKNLEVPPPENLAPTTRLREYQLEGYRWLMRLDHWRAGACLADDMGLGKTIQTIAFIAQKAAEGPILIVAPTSVCPNWTDEIARFAPSLQTVVFGPGDRAEILRNMKPGMVMISSYGLLQSQVSTFTDTVWRVVVLDEAQAIKNVQAKRSQAALQLKAKFRIATTGTPIENNLGELWTLFQFITPGLLCSSKQAFQARFPTSGEDSCQDAASMQQLNTLIKPFLLRRKKDEVLTELPAKTEKTIRIELSPEERSFYEAVRRNLIQEIDCDNIDKEQRCRILKAITKLRQAACNPKLIDPTTTLTSAKLEEFKSLITDLQQCGHATLVFSQYVKHLDIIRPTLHELNISFEYLDGATPSKDREEAVRNFQAGKADVFLISLKAGGLGLNLTRADNVIILDPWWNPAVEDQAADRAHRLGQSRPVTIYRLIAHDTIEDQIIELHNRKKDLAIQLLEGSNIALNLSSEELLKLIQGTTKS